jgi:hypothetical protein
VIPSKQQLLYFCKDVNGLNKNASGGYSLPGKDAVNVFDTVISRYIAIHIAKARNIKSICAGYWLVMCHT